MLHEKSRTRSVDHALTETGPVFARRDSENPSGYALLLSLLIAIFIGSIIFWYYPLASSEKNDHPDMPWYEQSLLVKSGKSPKNPPSDEQAQLTKDLYYTSEAEKDGDGRGKIMMKISADGMIKGGWSADYDMGPKIQTKRQDYRVNFLVTDAGFQGNIAPKKIYTDEQGKDPSKLYFITKGSLTLIETSNNTGRVNKVSGDIYVTGWIDPDYSVTGNIIIISERNSSQSWETYQNWETSQFLSKSYQSFSWQAKPSEPK